jgi:glutamate---cysteine ligase / carboxylate-amine ligase
MTQPLAFECSNPSFIGMEMEWQLLNNQSLDLTESILPLMALHPMAPYVKQEFIQNTVEVASRVCGSLAELETHLLEVTRDLKAKCRELGITLCGAGTHPFGQHLGIITPMPRYQAMEAAEGLPSHTQITFATHVHIGMESGDEAIRIMRALKAYLPLLIALSASSPFWRGYDTGHAAYRHRILAATRSYGVPPSFASWQDFEHFFDLGRRAGMFQVIKDIHWDIRPHPDFGSLEIRVMDAQPTIAAAVDLAGFIRALVFFLRCQDEMRSPRGLPQPLPWWIEKHNHFQAAHLGWEANYIQDEQGGIVPLREVFAKTLAAIQDTAVGLEQGVNLERLRRTVDSGVSYQQQRRVYAQTHSMKRVVLSLVEALDREVAESRLATGAVAGEEKPLSAG